MCDAAEVYKNQIIFRCISPLMGLIELIPYLSIDFLNEFYKIYVLFLLFYFCAIVYVHAIDLVLNFHALVFSLSPFRIKEVAPRSI